MSSETDGNGQYLAPPVLEMFERYQDGLPHSFVRAVRCGPDRLHPATFDDCPWPLEWVLYWYRVHTWCADAACRCKRSPRHGDGLCIAAFSDGRYGYYFLSPSYDGKNAIRWADLAANGECLTSEDLDALEGQCPRAAVGSDAAPSQDAVQAVWRTLRAGGGGRDNKSGKRIAGEAWRLPEWTGKSFPDPDPE
jgi:hypothetical protein